MSKISFLIVGSGYRAKFYARIALKHSEYFEAMMLCRSEEKAKSVALEIGIKATISIEECIKFKPMFVVVVVNKDGIFEVTNTWVNKGYAVLAETPAGTNMEVLNKLWYLKENGAKIVISEQYHRYPYIASILKAISDNLIGEVSSAYISLAHDYHAANIINHIFKKNNYSIRANRILNKVVETDSREGIITDGRVATKKRDIAFIKYSNNKEVIYDFSSVEYRSFIRTRNIIIRGEKGEINNNLLLGLDNDNKPYTKYLLPYIPDRYINLANKIFDKSYFNTSIFNLDLNQDEFAVASILFDMPSFIKGDIEIYSLDKALDDSYFWLLLEESINSSSEVYTSDRIWKQ